MGCTYQLSNEHELSWVVVDDSMSEMLCGVVSEIVPRLIGTVTTIPELKEQLITDFLAGKPSRYEEKVSYVLRFSRDNKAIHKHIRTMGWRLYATNAPVSTLSLSSAIQLHRGSPRIERDFARLKGKHLGIRPLYVQREDHIIGVVRLLSLALRVLTAIEYVVRQRLIRLNKSIAGLYAGNPKRKTNQPMTERLLKAFKGVTFTEMTTSYSTTHKHLTSLTDVQSQILRLLGYSKSIYTQLATKTQHRKHQPIDDYLAGKGTYNTPFFKTQPTERLTCKGGNPPQRAESACFHFATRSPRASTEKGLFFSAS